MLVENIVLKSGIKEAVVKGLRVELFNHPINKKDKPIEIIEIDLEKELMIWTCFCYDGKSSISKTHPWQLEQGEKANVKEALFQLYELV
jgi:hypothetical protein